MNCSELREHYGLDAIGLAAETEHKEIGAHLDRRCEACGEAMRRAREAAAVLGIAAREGEPAPVVRRIVAAAGRQSHGAAWNLVLGGALLFALVACFYFAGRENDTGRELGRVNEIRRVQNIALTRDNDAFAILGAADARMAADAAGKVWVSASQGVALIANLPPAPAGKAYEMWVTAKDGKPRAAGVFQAVAVGATVHVARGGMESGAETVTVTVEDAAGAAAPATAPVFAARIPAAAE